MADNRVAYGLAKKYGIDTTGMSPKEVWEALRKKGITEKNVSDGAYNSQSDGVKERAQAVVEKRKATKDSEENSGRYGGSGGDIRKAVDNYKPNDLKSTVDRYKELERKYNDDLTAEPPKHKKGYSKSVDSAVMNKYSSVRRQVNKKGYATVKVNDGKNFYIVRINKSEDDFNYDILKVWKIND